MLIFKIASFTTADDIILTAFGHTVQYVAPSVFSSFTALRVATACKKETPDAVFTYSLRDAMAALSAKTINSIVPPYPVLMFASSHFKVPKSINSEIAEKIDALVFDSEATEAKWQKAANIEKVKIKTVVPPAAENIPVVRTRTAEQPRTLTYFGNFSDVTALKKILESIARTDMTDSIQIRICGTGKAAVVMPIVKRTRANRLPVVWLGDGFDLEKELAQTDGFIPSGDVHTDIEIRMLANGIPPVTEQSLSAWMEARNETEAALNAKRIYEANHTPGKYAEKINALINDIK